MNRPFPGVSALGDISHHFWQLRGVSKSMNIDLSAAMADGRLRDTDYAAMVTACRACPNNQGCMAWLGCQQQIAQAPPPGCVNGEVLTRLKP